MLHEVNVDEVYDHTKPSKVVCMLSMHTYIHRVCGYTYYIYYNSGILIIY